MSGNETPPIAVNPSPASDQVQAGLRSLVLVIGAVGAILGFVGKHDLAGLINYLQSAAFVPAALVLASAASFVWGQWKTRHRAKQLISVASSPAVPDSVAKLKS